MVLFRVKGKRVVLQWFCLGSNEKALVPVASRGFAQDKLDIIEESNGFITKSPVQPGTSPDMVSTTDGVP